MIEIEAERYVTFPVYWCGLCNHYTPHLLLHAVTQATPRAIARCQACDRTHVVKVDEVIE